MTIPNVEALVVDRLVAFFSDIEGINRVYRHPVYSPSGEDVPYAFIIIGGMSEETPSRSSGRARIQRVYTVRLNFGFIHQGEHLQEGSEMFKKAEPFFNRVRTALLNNPYLQCSTYPEKLSYMTDAVLFRDTGYIIPAETRLPCYMDFQLTIALSFTVPTRG